MDKLHLYLSGPMSGYPDYNRPAFAAARKALRDRGHRVTCPAESGLTPSPEVTWADYLRHDLRLLLDVEAVAVLPGWELSRGARLEVDVAHRLGLPTYPVEQLLQWSPSLVNEPTPAIHPFGPNGVGITLSAAAPGPGDLRFEDNQIAYLREPLPGEGIPAANLAVFVDEAQRPLFPNPADLAAAAHRRRIRRASSS